MQKLSRHTKFKVVAGYSLLTVICFIAILFIYRQVVQLAVDDTENGHANQKLYMIGNTVTGLYEAETLSNSFLESGSGNTILRFVDVMKQVEAAIDSLKLLTTRPDQKLKIDTIELLLNEKKQNLRELIQAKKILTSDNFYHKAIETIESNRDSIREYLNIHRKVITTTDSSYIKSPKKKKGFLGLFSSKEPDSSLKVTVSKQMISDTVNTRLTDTGTDSMVSMLKNVWVDIQQQNQDISRQIHQKERKLIQKSADITEQLRRVLSDFEKEEINHSIRKIEQKQQVVNRTTAITAWIAAGAFLLIILFCCFILRDLSRSQRYRKELEAANHYADQLLESREKLMLSVTHDIKSPLSSVMGYIELLNNTSIDERQRYFLKNMSNSSGHILNLVTNLLDLSKLESNNIRPEEVGYNPFQLFTETGESFIPLAGKKGLELTVNICNELNAEYLGDALRIRQITVNLLSNAVKYTRQGKVELRVKLTGSGEKLTIDVEDSGPGMTEEEQKVIFKEFTRLTSAANSSTEGTGLGLTITRKLVELLGGEITLKSRIGEGSCFTVRLPLKKSPVQRDLSPEKPAIGEMIPDKNLEILLVDDDILQLEMTAALLKSKGITADTTTAPAEIIQLLEAHTYDLILSDIQMPESDGFELVRNIRESALPFAREIPVVALSARSDMEEAYYKKAGFSAYLNKPFTPAQLFTLIGRLTGHKRPAEDVKTVPEGKGRNGKYTLKNIRVFADQDEEVVKKILISFFRDTRQHTELLETTREPEKIRSIAHKMLPMFRQFETTEIIGELQKLERSDKTPLSTEETERATREVIRLCNELIGIMADELPPSQSIE